MFYYPVEKMETYQLFGEFLPSVKWKIDLSFYIHTGQLKNVRNICPRQSTL